MISRIASAGHLRVNSENLPLTHRLLGMAGAHSVGKKRNADVIAAEISATCQNLTQTVSDLEDYVKPANIATRGLDAATGSMKMATFVWSAQSQPQLLELH